MIKGVVAIVLFIMLSASALAEKIYCPNVPLIKGTHSGSWVAPEGWKIVQKVELTNLHPISEPSSTLARIGEHEQDGKKVCSYLFTPQTCRVCILKLKQN